MLRAFYTLQDTRTPFFLNCAENALNIVLAFVLVRSFGVVGLAVAYAIAYTVSAVAALVVLTDRHPGFDLAGLVRSVATVRARRPSSWLPR